MVVKFEHDKEKHKILKSRLKWEYGTEELKWCQVKERGLVKFASLFFLCTSNPQTSNPGYYFWSTLWVIILSTKATVELATILLFFKDLHFLKMSEWQLDRENTW